MNAVHAFAGAFLLFRQLNGVLRVAWAALLVGFGFAVVGYFSGQARQNWAGWSCLLAGGLLAVGDLRFRRTNRESTGRFFAALSVSLIGSLVALVLMLALVAVVVAWSGWTQGWSWKETWRQTLHLVHFTSLYFVLFALMGVPITMRIRGQDDLDDSSGGPQGPDGPAGSPSSLRPGRPGVLTMRAALPRGE